jgi:OOP family OmpA-OmpF porin
MKKSLIKNILGLGLLWLSANPAFAQSAAPKTVVVPPQPYVFEIPRKLPEIINSKVEETMPVLSQDGKILYFVRVLHPENIGGRLSGHDIWYSYRNADGSWQDPKNGLLSLNNKGNNAVLGFSQEGNRVFLLNQYGSGPSFKSGLSYAELAGSRWAYPKEVKIPKLKKDGFFYNAYLSPDEEVLIVSMKQRTQPGDEDLYIAIRQSDGRWSDFQNMGAKINTPGFEAFPYLSADKQTLYFSSNGHGGFGDADIFMSARQDESWTNWSKPINLGKPVNSKGFDASFALYTDSTAFFVSNREGGMSDIYQTRIARPLEQKEQTVPIIFQELTENEMEELKPTPEDNSMADLSDNKKEAIVVEDVYPLTVSIYFAFDSFQLSPEAQIKLRELFQKYTNGNDIKVGLTGHTDAIGTESYNKRLSVNRAFSAEEFLINAGLAQERVYAQGKGEAEPAATNDTPEGRRQNRRVTIMVVK